MPQHPLFAIASAAVSRLSTYVVLILAAHLLPPERFGAFAALAVVGAVVNAVVSGGGDMWLNRFTWNMPRRLRQAPRLWRHYVIITATLALIAVVAAVAVANGIEGLRPYRTDIVLAISWAAVAGLAEGLLAIIRASGLTRLFFGLRDFAAPVAILALIIIARPSTAAGVFAIFTVVWSLVAGGLAVVLIAKAGTLLPAARGRKGLWRKVITHTLGLVYGNLGSRLAIHIDVLVLTWAITLTELGEYRVASQIAIGFIVVQHFVFLALPWQIREIGTPRNPGAGHAWVVWRQRGLLGMAFAALVVLWVAAEPVLLLFGERFADVAPVFRALLAIRFIDLLWGPQHEILVSNGRVLEDAQSNLVALAGWIVGFAVCQQFISPLAAAVAGNVVASLLGQGVRYRMIEAAGLRHGAGHAFGAALPAACSTAVIVVALAVL